MRAITHLLLTTIITPFLLAQENPTGPADEIPKDLVPIQTASHTHFAFLCIDEKIIAPADKIIPALTASFELTDPNQILNFKRNEEKGTLAFTIGKARFVATLSDFPMPKGDIQYAANNSIHWPNAFQTLEKHQAHFTVTCTSIYPKPWMTSMALSKAIVALTNTHTPFGIYWGDASIVHLPATFTALAKHPLDPNSKNIPIDLWVGILLEKNKQGTTSAYTDGMQVLGFKEMEIHNSAKNAVDLYTILHKLTNFTINNGIHVKNQTPIKLDETTTLQTKFGPSAIGKKQTVIIIQP